eukprot:4521346-Amphidinium_carterae.1
MSQCMQREPGPTCRHGLHAACCQGLSREYVNNTVWASICADLASGLEETAGHASAGASFCGASYRDIVGTCLRIVCGGMSLQTLKKC